MRGVEAVASGSTDNAAILVHGGRANLDDSSFTATGGTNAFGVYLSGGCNYSMDGVDVTASGATTTWGVRLNRCDGNPIANSEIRSTQIGIKGDSSQGFAATAQAEQRGSRTRSSTARRIRSESPCCTR